MKMRKVGVLSLAINTAIYAGLLGLLVGVLFAGMSLMGVASGAEGAGVLAGVGVMAAVLFPLFYAAAGFIGGLIGALFFNLALKITGGLELDLA